MKRFLLATTFGLLAGISLFLTRGDAQPNSVKQIAPGVWFREGDLEHEGHCNNIIIEMKDYLIVVDANFPSGARLVLEDAKKVSPEAGEIRLRHPSSRRSHVWKRRLDQSRSHHHRI